MAGNANVFWVKESPVDILVGESRSLPITVSEIGTPTSPSVAMYDQGGVDVSSSTLSGSASVDGDNRIVMPLFTPASEQMYLMVVTFAVGSETYLVLCNVMARVPNGATFRRM